MPSTQKTQKKKGLKSWIPNWLRDLFPLGRYLYRLFKYNLAIKRQIPKASVYYIHYFDCAPAVYLAAKRCNARLIYDAHDCHAKIKPVTTRQRTSFQGLHKKLEGWCVARATAFITVAEGIADLHQGLFGLRPQVIRNCHDSRLDQSREAPMKQQLGLPSGTFLIAVVGMANPGMPWQELFTALQRLPDRIHVALVGNGYDSCLKGEDYDAVRQRIWHIPAKNPFELVPFLRDAECGMILYTALTENYQYSLPNKFFQSISAELPVLYPDLPEIDRLASQYQLGINLGSLKADAIVKAVELLLTQPDRYAVFKDNCRRAARELSWEQEEKILQKILR